MPRRANPHQLPLRVFVCLLTLILLIPPCIAQSPTVHPQTPDGMMPTGMSAGAMDCCTVTSAIQAPKPCCALNPQPAELSGATASFTLSNISNRVLLPGLAAIPAPAPQSIRITASPPPPLHPILRI